MASSTVCCCFYLASGLTLIFGIMGVINLARQLLHGRCLSGLLACQDDRQSLVRDSARPTHRPCHWSTAWTTLFSRLYKRDHLYQVLLTFGLILVFEELRSILFGDDVHGVAVPALLDYSVPSRILSLSGLPLVRHGGLLGHCSRERCTW